MRFFVFSGRLGWGGVVRRQSSGAGCVCVCAGASGEGAAVISAADCAAGFFAAAFVARFAVVVFSGAGFFAFEAEDFALFGFSVAGAAAAAFVGERFASGTA